MNVPKFNEREKALEDEYIRRKEYVAFYIHVLCTRPSSYNPSPTMSANVLSY